MSVCVIKNTQPKNTSIPVAMAVGAASGLALRHFLPVSKPEIDTVMFGEPEFLQEASVKMAKKDIFSNLKKALNADKNNQALNLFYERAEASMKYDSAHTKELKDKAVALAKAAKEKIKNAPDAVKKEIKDLTQSCVNKIKVARVLSEANVKNLVKAKRSYTAFLLPGIALGALASYVYNVIGTINQD